MKHATRVKNLLESGVILGAVSFVDGLGNCILAGCKFKASDGHGIVNRTSDGWDCSASPSPIVSIVFISAATRRGWQPCVITSTRF